MENGFIDVLNENKDIKYKYKTCIDTYDYSYINEKDEKIRDKRILTYNYALAKKQISEIDKMHKKALSISMAKGENSEYGESSKYVIFQRKSKEKIFFAINEDKIKRDKEVAGYNLLVTSELFMDDKEIYNTYHRLWAIEQTFRIMKSELDTRLVYLQKEDSIKGHFLICYTTVLL